MSAEFPLWSFSKQRNSKTRLHIDYDDGSFMTLVAPLGMPSPRFPGYLDVILFYGQRDLFLREYVEIPVYQILKTLDIDATNGERMHISMRTWRKPLLPFSKQTASETPQLASGIM